MKVVSSRWSVVSLTLSAMLFALCLSVEAQQSAKVPRIGYLSPLEPVREASRAQTIRLALRELGWIEGQNIAIEYRYAEGKRDRQPELADFRLATAMDESLFKQWTNN